MNAVTAQLSTESTALPFTFAVETGQRLDEAFRVIKSSLPKLPCLKMIGDVLNPHPAFGRTTPRSKFPARFNEQTKCLWLTKLYPHEDCCTHFDGICRKESKDLFMTEDGRLIQWLYRYESMGSFEGRGCQSSCRCERLHEEGKISAFFWISKDEFATFFAPDEMLEERILCELKLIIELNALPLQGKAPTKDALSLRAAFANI